MSQMKRIPAAMAMSVAVAAAVASFGAQAQAATQTTRYVLINETGKQTGEQVVERADDGLTKVRFIYKNNGRGPELTEQLRYAADGTMASYAVQGNSTFGAVVDDKFDYQDGKAVWKSTTEQGAQAVRGSAMYVPLNSSFEVASATIAALSAAPDGKLALLPSGTLTQRKLAELRLSREGAPAQTVQLLAQTGLGLSPQFYWATTDARPRLFAVVIPGVFTAIEDGWQGQDNSNITALAARQKEAEQAMLAELASALQHPLNGLTVVRNARVFDSDKATLGAPSDVYVLRGRITAVLPAGAPVRGAVNEIDAAGRVLLPGLFDMHAHVGRWEGGLNIAAGVTSVRDMGNDNTQLQQILDETAAGKLLSPQVVPAGFLEGESQYAANGGFVVSTLPQAKNAIDWYAEHGYPQLKIYNSFPKAILKDTVAYAHSRGLRVSGHIPAGLRAFEALDAGYDEIQHINQLMLNFLATPQTETRTPGQTENRDRSHAGHLRLPEAERRRPEHAVRGRGQPHAAGRAARLPRRHHEDCRRCHAQTLPEVLRQDGRIRRPPVPRRRAHRGRHRRDGGLHVAGRTGNAGAGRPHAGPGAAGRHAQRRAVHAHQPRARQHRAGQAGRPGAGRWRPDRAHRRRAQGGGRHHAWLPGVSA
jgi:hypothetical protein